jgi:hypothetical protein
MVSAQYPSGILTLLGLADMVKSGVVARTGCVKPTVPSTVSVNSMTIMVLEPRPFRKPLYLLALAGLELSLLGHLSALYTSADDLGFSKPRMGVESSVFSSSQDCDAGKDG